MSWFRKKEGAWDLAGVTPPWQGTVSIHAHIASHLAPDKGLTEGGDTLPDERPADGGVRWVAGGLDGAFGHHGTPGAATDRAKLVHRALGVVLQDASPEKLRKLYDLVLGGSVMELVDPLLERIRATGDLDRVRLHQLAAWFARNAPDRAPVKLGIALLGTAGARDELELLHTLGRHEELTLFVAVAIANGAGDAAERELFRLAKQVDGWGRIHLVERLAETRDSTIQDWMLREGYRNSIMYEYLAYTCATSGGLRRALTRPDVDDELLENAGELIASLIQGGPAQDMDDYADGPIVVERFLHHVERATPALWQLDTIGTILRFVDAARDWKPREARGWTFAMRDLLRRRALSIQARPGWPALVDAGLASDDERAFHAADQAARVLGIDTWEIHFARLGSGRGDNWWIVMQTRDAARIDRVLALAEARLPLDAIASGPADEIGLGPAWRDHGHLGFVLQDLRRFAGKGWPLIHAGLRSPVVRNRNAALIALSRWGRAAWPPDAEAALWTSLREEPRAQVRSLIEQVLAGERIDTPPLALE
jgi:hypothetical protein